MGRTGELTGKNVIRTDWPQVVEILDELPAGTTVYVGEFDQSMSSHINSGRIKYIDARKYDTWTQTIDPKGIRASLFMRKKGTHEVN